MKTVKHFILPINGEIFFSEAGDTEALNHHHRCAALRYAFDIVALGRTKKTYRSNGKSNKDYYIFGRKILCPFDGEVIEAVDGVRDNYPGKTNQYMAAGNTVMLKHDMRTYSVLAHFMKGSLLVRVGQMVHAGQVIGRCGNSGDSTEPHLHFHIQNTPDAGKGYGFKCFFKSVLKNGKIFQCYSPVKGDILESVGITIPFSVRPQAAAAEG